MIETANRNDRFGLKEGDSYIGTDGHHHHFHEGLKEGDWYVGTDGHHHHYHDVVSVHKKFSIKNFIKKIKKSMFTSNNIKHEEYANRHKGLVEGQLYIGSDGHHHHYHAKRDYKDDSEDYKHHTYNARRLRKRLAKALFTFLVILAIAVVAYAAYIYTIE